MASSAQWLTFTKPFCGIALGLGGLFAGMGVVHRQQAAHLVVGVILHPAVGIAHLRDAGHAS